MEFAMLHKLAFGYSRAPCACMPSILMQTCLALCDTAMHIDVDEHVCVDAALQSPGVLSSLKQLQGRSVVHLSIPALHKHRLHGPL